ncbi:MAG TPA: glycosyltransferase family 4 protein [Hyphomicrobium sp.]|nr:glycosyltransferase family 4 protein [Hyphomicrobium sp.]HRO51350.1 glycosyltransferase family 4 protein [Hyphomicrobium sp.]
MTHTVSERIALVAPSAEAAAVLRKDLIKDLVGRGHRVLCLTPPGPGMYHRMLRDYGAQNRSIDVPHQTLRLLVEWKTLSSLIAHFNDWQPNIVMGFGPRMLMLAAIAARRAGVRRVVSLVNSLPSDGIESIGRRRFAYAVRTSDAIVFHNRDHARALADLGMLPPNLPMAVVPGSGVNLADFKSVPLPPHEDGVVFLMLGRLERRRGVLEYKAAAETLKAQWPTARFRFAGPESDEVDAIPRDALSGVVEDLGHLEDVRPALAACHVFVYPSYSEGMPRAVLEALATGRPVVTTRTSGCKETVDEKVSGCLVPPADAPALARAMAGYLARPELLPIGARAARLKAERRFDVREVNATLLRLLGLA